MPARTRFALIVCGAIAFGSIATGLDLVLRRGCEVGAASVTGIALGALAIGMGALSVWVPR